MKHQTMYINRGIEVNIARKELTRYMSAEQAALYIPEEGGYIANLFNQHHQNLDAWIDAIYDALHENRERHRQYERAASARQRGLHTCPHCQAAYKKPRMVQGYSSWGNPDTYATCPECGKELE